MAVTESMGAIYDRTQRAPRHDRQGDHPHAHHAAQAAKDLANGIEPPATGPVAALRPRSFSAEKVLAPGEDWRDLGTDRDPIFGGRGAA